MIIFTPFFCINNCNIRVTSKLNFDKWRLPTHFVVAGHIYLGYQVMVGLTAVRLVRGFFRIYLSFADCSHLVKCPGMSSFLSRQVSAVRHLLTLIVLSSFLHLVSKHNRYKMNQYLQTYKFEEFIIVRFVIIRILKQKT